MKRYGFRLEPIPANYDSARKVQEVVYQDFAALPGMSETDARSIADPTSEDSVGAQYRVLDGDPTAYLGVKLNDMLYGVVKLREWLYGDAKDFVPVADTIKAKLRYQLEGADKSSQGLHVLARSSKIGQHGRDEVTAEMLDLVVSHLRELGRHGLQKVTTLTAAVDLKDYALQAAFDQYPAGARDGIVAPVTVKGVLRTDGITRPHILREAKLGINTPD